MDIYLKDQLVKTLLEAQKLLVEGRATVKTYRQLAEEQLLEAQERRARRNAPPPTEEEIQRVSDGLPSW